MTLQKAVFFAAIVVHAAFLLAVLAVLVVVAINIVRPNSIPIDIGWPAIFVFATYIALRLGLALWLKLLGGVPAEFKDQ